MWWMMALGAGVLLGYAALVATARLRYGRAPAAPQAFADPLLDEYFPHYEVVERHHVLIDAPAATVHAAACEMDLRSSRLARLIFDTRGLLMGAARAERSPRGLLEEMQTIGWGVLADVPDREVVVGAICRPWEGTPHFQALAPDVFRGFCEPGYVKIVWNLRAVPLPDGKTLFTTETRAAGTDAMASQRFRRYWSWVAPGVSLIRWLSLMPLKRAAEARARMKAEPLAGDAH